MKKSANGNMYEVALGQAWDLFGAYMTGSYTALICVVSSLDIDETSRVALDNSAEALGYGKDACTFISLCAPALTNAAHAGECCDNPTKDQESQIESTALDQQETQRNLNAQALFLLLEGLDPLCLIATDEQAAQTLAQAYRCEVPPEQACRVFGRPCVAFQSFSSMLNNPQDKQIAWALLKRLPKFGEH